VAGDGADRGRRRGHGDGIAQFLADDAGRDGDLAVGAAE
jgi:hypothetical protein